VQSEKVNKTFAYLAELFGENPKCELNYTSDIDLLVAIVLSAQCTDIRVNKVTAQLFKKYKTIKDYASANPDELMSEIHSCGFYRAKATNIISMCRDIIEKYDCKIPTSIDELTKLRGVGRKTASVFLAEFHGIPALAVDTHVIRVSNRLGFSASKNPVIIEHDLAKIFDTQNWGKYHLYLVLFGRYKCKSRQPKCSECKIHNLQCTMKRQSN
jgi:endonuclease-3